MKNLFRLRNEIDNSTTKQIKLTSAKIKDEIISDIKTLFDDEGYYYKPIRCFLEQQLYRI